MFVVLTESLMAFWILAMSGCSIILAVTGMNQGLTATACEKLIAAIFLQPSTVGGYVRYFYQEDRECARNHQTALSWLIGNGHRTIYRQYPLNNIQEKQD